MKTPKKSRNRRNKRLIASFAPVAGPSRIRWFTQFSERLPEFAAQLGLTAAEAASRADAIRTKFMKTPKQPSTP